MVQHFQKHSQILKLKFERFLENGPERVKLDLGILFYLVDLPFVQIFSIMKSFTQMSFKTILRIIFVFTICTVPHFECFELFFIFISYQRFFCSETLFSTSDLSINFDLAMIFQAMLKRIFEFHF